MKPISLLLLSLLLGGCATIINKPHAKTYVFSREPARISVDSATYHIGNNARRGRLPSIGIQLKRGRDDKTMVIERGGRVDTIVLRSQWSAAYYCNAFFTYGVGFIFDGRTPKKWGYAQNISLDDRTIERLSPANIRDRYTRKGTLNLRGGLPWVNWFDLDYAGRGRRSNAGFIGLSAGLEYFYCDDVFVNVSVTGITDFFVLFPGAVDFEGMHDHMYSVYGSVSHNHMLGRRFSIGYGIAYGHESWNTVNSGRWDKDMLEEVRNQPGVYRKSNSLGMVVPMYYYTKRQFYMGIIYRPMLVQFTGGARWRYQHTTSFELGWRVRLTK